MRKVAVIGETLVVRQDGFTEYVFLVPGLKNLSVPHASTGPEQEATAKDMGLHVEQMNAGHDLVHTLLAHWLGAPYSPTLAMVAGGPKISQELNDAEEAAVLAVQKYMALLHVHPVSRASWEIK